MSFCYNKLWKMLIDRDMTKGDLRSGINVSWGVIAKMGKGEPISGRALDNICTFLKCQPVDIMDHIPDNKQPEEI